MKAEEVWDSMVALVRPDPEQSNGSARELNNRLNLAKMLDKTEPALLFEASKLVAAAMKDQNKEFDQLRKELDAARAKDDKEKAKEI
jgi:hypothetical protein